MTTKIDISNQDFYWGVINKSKDTYRKKVRNMSFEEKLSIVPILQEKAVAMGHNIRIWGEVK